MIQPTGETGDEDDLVRAARDGDFQRQLGIREVLLGGDTDDLHARAGRRFAEGVKIPDKDIHPVGQRVGGTQTGIRRDAEIVRLGVFGDEVRVDRSPGLQTSSHELTSRH